MFKEIVIKDNNTVVVSYLDPNYEFSDKKLPASKKEEEFRSKDFLAGLMGYDSRSSILPKNCKFYQRMDALDSVCIIEEDPCIRTIKVNFGFQADIERLEKNGLLKEYGLEDFLKKQPDPPYQLNLSFPYIIYMLHLNMDGYLSDLTLFYRLHPLTSLNDYLLIPNLTNVQQGTPYVCLGGGGISSTNLIDVAQQAIDKFWLNEFNTDYCQNYQAYGDTRGVSSYLEWAYSTKNDPMFVFSVPWKPHPNTLSEEIHKRQRLTHDKMFTVDRIMTMVKKSESDNGNKDEMKSRSYADSILISKDESKFISVGDELVYQDKKWFVNSIIMLRSNLKKRHIELMDDSGTTLKVELTKEVLENFERQLYQDNTFKTVEAFGRTFNVNDIVVIEIPEINKKSFHKITKIRKNYADSIDLIFGKECYILNEKTVNYFKETGEILFNDTKLIEKSEYCLLAKDDYSVIFHMDTVKYRTLIFRDNGRVSFGFTMHGGDYDIRTEDAHRYIISKKEEINNFKYPAFKIANKLYTNTSDSMYEYFIINKTIVKNHKNNNGKYTNGDFPLYNEEIAKGRVQLHRNRFLGHRVDGCG